MNISIKTPEEIEFMRRAGAILTKAQDAMKKRIVPGVSLLELDKIAEDIILSEGSKPAFKGHQGFPATICTAINEEVVHGIPSDRILREGDIFTIDCGAIWKGFFSDAAFTVIVGGDETNPERAAFSNKVKSAMMAGIAQAKAGNRLGDIGAAVEAEVLAGGYSICREFCGHGLGTSLWEDPYVLNYGKPGKGMRLKEGMVLCIEPIVAMKGARTKTLKDEWTVVTVDGSDACQWEHCGLVTSSGFEIFA